VAGATVVVAAIDVAGGVVVGATSVVEDADEAGAVVDVAVSRPPVSPVADEMAPVADEPASTASASVAAAGVELVDFISVNSEPESCPSWIDGTPLAASCSSPESAATGLTLLVAVADRAELVDGVIAS